MITGLLVRVCVSGSSGMVPVTDISQDEST